MSGPSLEQVVNDLDNLPPLPSLVIELMDSLRGADPDIEAIGYRIAQDQALAARLLRIANSSFYGMQSRVATVHDAMIVLGFRAVRTMVMAVGITGGLRSIQTRGFNQRCFWLHNIGTGISAKVLAARLRLNEDSAFTAGLLHDMGQLVLVARFPEQFRQVAEYRAQHDCLSLVAEQDVLGFDHAQIGSALARRWKFAGEIVDAIEGHHRPEEQGAGSLAVLVHVADVMAHSLDFAQNSNALMPPLSEVAWNRLGFTWQDFKSLLAEADALRDDADLLL